MRIDMNPLSRREVLQLLAMAAALPAAAAAQVSSKDSVAPLVPEKIKERFQSLPFESQQIGGLLAQRMQINVERGLLQADDAAYLAGFVNRARKEGVGDEPTGTDWWMGEGVGKFLDAVSNALRYTHDARLQALADRVASTLIASQAPDGYLGTYPSNFRWTGWDVWIHKYNLVGLLSYYEATGHRAALQACERIGDLLSVTFGERPGQRDIVFNAAKVPDLVVGTQGGVESTSILEPICKLYRHTGNARYLDFAHYIVRAHAHPGAPDLIRSPIDPNHISRCKAYEVVSNLIGFLDLYRITGDEKLLAVVLRGWEYIHDTQLYITGAASTHENFQPPGQRLSLYSSAVGENCVTVTWMQLNWRLLRLTGEARYGQEIERTVYNHLLAAHDPATGGFAYYTSLSGHKRFSSGHFCCNFSGKRGLSLLPQLVWGLQDNALVVNLYTEGRASFDIDGVGVQIQSRTAFPVDGDVLLEINPQRAKRFTVRLRVPEWAQQFEVIQGSKRVRGTAGQMLDLTQTWVPRSTVKIHIGLTTRVISGAPSYPDSIALQRGPQILALEQGLNPGVAHLHRCAVHSMRDTFEAAAVSLLAEWKDTQVYAVEGIVGQTNGSGKLDPVQTKLLFVPFADSKDYRVWVLRPDRFRTDIPPVTAYCKAAVFPDKLRPGTDPLEYLTDEDPQSFCTVDPRNYGLHAISQRKLGQRGDPVNFSVTLDEPAIISRIVFRHGASTQQGGWFDTSQGKPVVEAVLSPPPFFKGTRVFNTSHAQWEPIAHLERYPDTSATRAPDLEPGEALEIRLPKAQTVYAIRIVGRPGGDYASSAELSAWKT